LQDDIHGAVDAVLHEQFGRPKPLFILKVIGDDGPAGAQRKTGRRSEIGADGRYADDAKFPTYTSADQKAIFRRNVLQDLAKLCLHAFGRQSRGIAHQLIEACALKRRDSELGQYFLLPHPPFERA
jgi:hypothetical protein